MKVRALIEASYPGNMGVEEFFKFWGVATPAQVRHMEKLLNTNRMDKVWSYLQKVTKTRLMDPNQAADPLFRKRQKKRESGLRSRKWKLVE